MARQPDIILFNPDQWRGDAVGCHGDAAAQTPHLDRIAAEDGVSFRWAFCQNPVCTPSRCSFMTGWYPHTMGHRTMHHMLHAHEPVMLEELKKAGYRIWWGGKNDLLPGQEGWERAADELFRAGSGGAPNLHRLDEWRGNPQDDTFFSFFRGRVEGAHGQPYRDHDWLNVLGAAEEIRRTPHDQPLCIFLPLSFPHPPYHCEDPWFTAIDRAALPPRRPAPASWAGKPALLAGIAALQRLHGWSEERWTELRATYWAMCARTDHLLGLVLEALRETGRYDEAAIFVFSDHGDFTGDYGLVEKTQNTFEDCLSRVPFVIKPPRWSPVRPRVSEALVELVDLPATVYDLAGISPNYTHFGRSLLPVLAGGLDDHRDAVFCEGGRLPGERQAMELESARSGAASRGLYWPRLRWQTSDEGPHHGKAAMCRTRTRKYVRRLLESDELYDLERDPDERHNCIDDPAYHGDLIALRERMLTWYQETCDQVPWQPDARYFT